MRRKTRGRVTGSPSLIDEAHCRQPLSTKFCQVKGQAVQRTRKRNITLEHVASDRNN
jgi:hypothetical protein